jgi:hypothetical protein
MACPLRWKNGSASLRKVQTHRNMLEKIAIFISSSYVNEHKSCLKYVGPQEMPLHQKPWSTTWSLASRDVVTYAVDQGFGNVIFEVDYSELEHHWCDVWLIVLWSSQFWMRLASLDLLLRFSILCLLVVRINMRLSCSKYVIIREVCSKLYSFELMKLTISLKKIKNLGRKSST